MKIININNREIRKEKRGGKILLLSFVSWNWAEIEVVLLRNVVVPLPDESEHTATAITNYKKFLSCVFCIHTIGHENVYKT